MHHTVLHQEKNNTHFISLGSLKAFYSQLEPRIKCSKKQIKSSNPHLIEQYKIYRNKLTHLKELYKQNYFKSMFNKYNDNSKNLARIT